MRSQFHHRSSLAHHRVDSAFNRLHRAKRSHNIVEPPTTGFTTAKPPLFSSQAQPFLAELPTEEQHYSPQQTATQKLKTLIEEHSYNDFFAKAIKMVSEQNIPELSSIKTLEQFYFFLDALVTWIPEIRVWDWDGKILHERTVYSRLMQFYYYFNQAPLAALQSPIVPLEGERLSPISRWMRDFAIEWGHFLDTPASQEHVESFKYAPEYAWQDYEHPPEQYATFNEFFARKFKDIDVQRPVAQVDNERVIVFPAESTFVGQWAISTPVDAPVPAPAAIVVKHIEWTIAELLQDSRYGDAFQGGIFCHSFLNTYDYHCLHTAVAGRVLEAKFIPGQVYLEVKLKALEENDAEGNLARAVIPQRYLDAEDATGYQFVQCRGLLLLESAVGKVAILPIGMAQVSSVVFVTPEAEGQQPIVLTPEEKANLNYAQQITLLNKKIKQGLVGKYLKKGEMFSFFQFGGSDFVMVFERQANVDITAAVNVHYPVRSQCAISNINELRYY
ncbi:MAG: phosphatidylserine decarboxylase [Spirulina sp. SIO3F2]|nr:phosphatidylserine decarboxylase [Spirulina sp. SIO3F2]